MTKKDTVYQWTAPCHTTFDHIKCRLIEAPVLSFLDFIKQFTLETDASDYKKGMIVAAAGGPHNCQCFQFSYAIVLLLLGEYSTSNGNRVPFAIILNS